MMELDIRRCNYCKNRFSILMSCCPHCARPGLYPNVSLARRERERRALQFRFYEALQNATDNGTNDLLLQFGTAVESSVAVVCKSLDDVYRLVSNDKYLLASYYELTEGGTKLPDNDYWDRWRRIVDELIHPHFKKNIHFAALSLDGKGLTNYGRCSLVLKDKMIKHRATAFEGNTVTLVQKLLTASILKGMPFGYRSIWKDRSKLCIAKIHDKIKKGMANDDYPPLLLDCGKTTEEDNFVEVHVYGPITIHSVEKIIIHSICDITDDPRLDTIISESKKLGITVETP